MKKAIVNHFKITAYWQPAEHRTNTTDNSSITKIANLKIKKIKVVHKTKILEKMANSLQHKPFDQNCFYGEVHRLSWEFCSLAIVSIVHLLPTWKALDYFSFLLLIFKLKKKYFFVEKTTNNRQSLNCCHLLKALIRVNCHCCVCIQ